MSKKIGIAVDDWKLPVFREYLTNNGFEYEDAGEIVPGSTMLRVITGNVPALTELVLRANQECARQRRAGIL